RAVARLFALVNVGLLFLTDGDRARAAGVLADVSLREIFQVGFSRVADLKTAAAELARRYWPDWVARGFGFLEQDEAELMKGLMMRVPQYYGGAATGRGLRDFGTMDEVRMTAQALRELGAAARACFEKLGIPRPHEAKAALAEVFALGPEDITLGNLMLTGFVNFTLKGEFDIAPLARKDAGRVLNDVMAVGSAGSAGLGGRRVRPDRLERFLIWLGESTGFAPSEMEALSGFVRKQARGLEAEVGGLAAAEDLDPRYVRTILFER
ncbi:MAG TPA: DUF6178 family protein, partial [bacterium]|nr:DUF6178 family protein [bacterium]